MRVALVVPGGVDRSGTHRVIPFLLWLIERLARRHDVHVIVPRQEPEPSRWHLLGAEVHNIGRGPLRTRAVGALVGLHRRQPLDVIHAFWARGPGEIALAAASLCRVPLLVHVAGGELLWLPALGFGARWPWRRAMARHVLRRAAKVTVASGPMEEAVARVGVRPERVLLGADTRVWRPMAPRPRNPAEIPRVVHVGSLTPVKDHATLLGAVAELARQAFPVHLDLIGEDTSGGAVPRLARELGLDEQVRFHGYLAQDQVVPVVSAADVMAVTSVHEAGPVAMVEAATVGVPTVGTDVGHVRDWAPEAAVACPVGDVRAVAEALRRVLSEDALRLSLARKAQDRAVRCDADWTAHRFEALYRAVRQR